MAKYIEVNLTEIMEIPDNWEVVVDDEGNMAIQTDNNEYIDFESTILLADTNKSDEEIEWQSIVEENQIDELEARGFKEIQSDVEIYELDEDELDFDEEL
jgi:GDP-D-mannose dehydratase